MHVRIVVGLAFCIGGCAYLAILLAVRKPARSRNLSPETEREMNMVGSLSAPYTTGTFSPQLPFMDMAAIYIKSRSNRQDMHDRYLRHPCATNADVLEMVSNDHWNIKKLFLANLGERAIGTLGLGLPTVSSRVILRTFGEEQEALSHVAEK